MFNNPKKRKEANITLPDSPISATVQSFDLLPMVRHRLESMSLEARRECQEIVCYLLPMLKADFMSIFPSEINTKILGFLDLKSFVRCRLVNKAWMGSIDGVSADLTLWKKRLASEFPHVMAPPNPLDSNPRNHSYRAMYKFFYMTRRNWLTGRFKKLSFPGHAGNVVTWLLFDDDKIVSGSDDQSIHIYDIKEGELIKKLIGHEGGVWALQYYGSTLVSGSTDRTVRVWNMNTGRCTHIFEGHTSTVRCLLILPQNKKSSLPHYNSSSSINTSSDITDRPVLVTGSRDATLRVWSLPELNTSWFPEEPSSRNPYLKHVLTGHTNSVRAIAGHENILVSGSYDTSVRLWDLSTGSCLHVFNGHREKVYSVGYSHELRRAVSGSMDSTVKIWDTISGENLFTLEGHNSLVGLLELTPTYLVSAAADSTLRIWCPNSGKCLAILQGHDAAITCFHHDPANNRLVSGSDGGVKVWELSSAGYGSTNINSSGMIMPSNSLLSKSLPFVQTCQGPMPVHGRFIGDVVKDVQGVWKTRMDTTRLVCAVQDTERRTWFQILDFSEGEGLGTSRKTAGDRFYRDPDEDEMEVDDSEDDN